jgi:hypothetical protein
MRITVVRDSGFVDPAKAVVQNDGLSSRRLEAEKMGISEKRIAAFLLLAVLSSRAFGALTVSFHLAFDQANGTTPVPSNIQSEIMNAINSAMAVYNEWSNYNKHINVYYNSGVATADGNFNGTIRFGQGAQYRTPMVAFHEINHVMGAGTYGTWQQNVDNNAKLWLGPAGIAMSKQYFPNNTLKADYHIHWVGDGPAQNVDMFREGVHIVGALREDMGLSNGNLYDVPGDFNNSGVIGIEDYYILRANAHRPISPSFTASQAWRSGDYNLDRQVNYADLMAFTQAYNAFHGPGRLEAVLAQIPEPGGIALMAIGSSALIWRRRLIGSKAFIVFGLICGVVLSNSAQAQLRYVDATITGGSPNTGPLNAFKPGQDTQADDNLWSLRTGVSSGGTFLQSGDGDGENSPEIYTTISGLTPNSFYAVYTHFWDGSGTSPDWNVRAGFVSNPGGNKLFANPADAADIGATPAVLASSLSYIVAPTTMQESDRTMYAGLVGTTKSNASGQITVYIDDLPSTIGVNQRTWYDGLSYQPTTLQTLSLRVNTVTGAVSLRNETTNSHNLKYYEIKSASGLFDPIRWNSLDDQEAGNPIGTGWDELGGVTENLLSEYNLPSSTTFDPNMVKHLGKVFEAGAQGDIIFSYGLAGQDSLTTGFVDYISTPGLAADFNGDDVVNDADLAEWQGNYAVNSYSDADGDGDSDGRDFLIWQRQWGQTASVAAAVSVPEPCLSALVFLPALASLTCRSRVSR